MLQQIKLWADQVITQKAKLGQHHQSLVDIIMAAMYYTKQMSINYRSMVQHTNVAYDTSRQMWHINLRHMQDTCMIGQVHLLAQEFATIQLRCNFTLACQQFTRILEQFTHTRIELLMECALLPMRNSHKIIRLSSTAFDMITLQYHVIDHRNVHRLVLRLVLHSQNLCHRALLHQALIISNE